MGLGLERAKSVVPSLRYTLLVERNMYASCMSGQHDNRVSGLGSL